MEEEKKIEKEEGKSGEFPSYVVEDFQKARQTAFLRFCVQCLPRAYESQDINHVMIIYYVMHALDILGLLRPGEGAEAAGGSRPIVSEEDRRALIEYIYTLQVRATPLSRANDALGFGFAGAPWCVPDGSRYRVASAATTFGALCVLRELGDDLARVDRDAVAEGLRHLQQPDGSFAAAYQRKRLPETASAAERARAAVEDVGDCDLRFVFCACATCALLGDWRGVDTAAATRFVLACQAYDGAFGQGPLQEGHGGSTYCAIAALALMGTLDALPADRRRALVRWLVARQVSGFQGRINKPPDTCYGFWIGASLAILRAHDPDVPPATPPAHVSFVDNDTLCSFLLTCQGSTGGFCKDKDAYPDLVHTCLSIAALSIVCSFDPSLCCVFSFLMHCCFFFTLSNQKNRLDSQEWKKLTAQ